MNIAIDQLSKATKTQAEAQIQTMSAIAEKTMLGTGMVGAMVATAGARSPDHGAGVAW